MLQITMLFCPRLKHAANYNDFFVPGSKMLQIVMLFCPRLKNATNYNAFFVPDSKMLQITTLFCWTRLKKKKKVDFDTVRN